MIGLVAKITSIQAWNFQHRARPAKSVNSRALINNETAEKADVSSSMNSPILLQLVSPSSRRRVLSSIPTTLSACASLVFAWPASSAQARNMPVSNGADTSKVGTVSALIPIVELRSDLRALQETLREEKKNNVDGQLNTITKTKTSFSFTKAEGKSATIPIVEKDFKRLFDAYSDQVSYKQKFLDQNAFLVYYTGGYDGAGREKLEKNPVNERQTLQFGARNEAWIGWDDFLAEWGYFSSSSRRSNSDDDIEDSFSELMKYLSNIIEAVDRYLRLSPSQDLEAVQLEKL